MSRVEVVGVSKRFGATPVLDHVDLDVADGSRLALLGRSGSGKSTLLRILAGLQRPDSGVVRFDGRDVTVAPAESRDVGVVFQHLALFPHLDVSGNVAFGLRMRGVGRPERKRRVAEVLDVLDLRGYQRRDPATLSGGEAQRVAIARALAPAPRLLLLDEPFGALDQALRERLVADLAGVFDALEVTAVIVTHDPTEASALAAMMAVLVDGRILRSGRTADVIADPGSVSVARLTGHRNIVPARLVGEGADEPALVPPDAVRVLDPSAPAGTGEHIIAATVRSVLFRGGAGTVVVALADDALADPVLLECRVSGGGAMPVAGDEVRVAVRSAAIATLRTN